MPYLNVTTRLDDTPDEGMFGEKGGSGFPTLYFMEPETGAVLNEWWWPEDEETVRGELASATAKAAELTDLLRSAEQEPDDAALQATVAIRLAMMFAGELAMEELEAIGQTEGLDAELKSEFGLWLGGRKVEAAADQASDQAESRKEFEELVGQAFYDLAKAGVRVAPSHQIAGFYYENSLDAAIERGDAETAQAAFEGYAAAMEHMASERPSFADRIQESVDEVRARLDEFQGAGDEDA